MKAEDGDNRYTTLEDGQQSPCKTDGAVIEGMVVKHNSGVDITIEMAADGKPLVYYDTFLDQQLDGALNLIKKLFFPEKSLSGFFDYDEWIMIHPGWIDHGNDAVGEESK